jgi:hypothetical protein
MNVLSCTILLTFRYKIMVNPQIKLMLTIEKQSSRTMAKAFTFIVIFCGKFGVASPGDYLLQF